MNTVAVIVALLLLGALAGWGQASTIPYAQILTNQLTLRNPNISMLSIAIRNPTTGEDTVIASNISTMVGSRAGEEDLQVLAGGQPMTALDVAKHRCQALVPLRDVLRATIGTVRIAFASGNSSVSSDCLQEAEKLRDELGQVIPSLQALSDPFTVTSSANDTLAQRLTMETLARYPDVLVLAFHATAPGESVNRVVGINVPKFLGRPSDEVDQEVARTGKTIVQVIPSTHRMETHMPLRAADGSLVGALVTVYVWREEAETPGMISRSMGIRDELQARIPSLAALLSR